MNAIKCIKTHCGWTARLWLLPVLLGFGGCFTLRLTNPDDSTGKSALVSGDYRVRAGAVMNVFLRSVDDQPLKFWQHAVEVTEGEHRLLIDCIVTETDKASRHELNVSLQAGVHYRLTADATPQQGCSQINLERVK